MLGEGHEQILAAMIVVGDQAGQVLCLRGPGPDALLDGVDDELAGQRAPGSGPRKAAARSKSGSGFCRGTRNRSHRPNVPRRTVKIPNQRDSAAQLLRVSLNR